MTRLAELRRTKIVCTLGPASMGDKLPCLIKAGMNVARLNFSHGAHDQHAATLARVRDAAQKLARPVAVLQDLAGPKIRLGDFASDSVTLSPGQTFTLTRRQISGSNEECQVNTPEVISATPIGATVLLADGALEFEVVLKSADDLTCRVVAGGRLSSHQGVSLPGPSFLTGKKIQGSLLGSTRSACPSRPRR